MARFKLTDEQVQELRQAVYGRYNVRHEFIELADDDMRREAQCSLNRSAKCSGEKAQYARANKLYCRTCMERCNRERTRIVQRRAEPAARAAIESATTQKKYDELLASFR